MAAYLVDVAKVGANSLFSYGAACLASAPATINQKPRLQCMITVVQLGELHSREDEDLKIKFENNQLVFFTASGAKWDPYRGRMDLIFLEAEIEKALETEPPKTDELRLLYGYAAKGLEALLKNYKKEKTTKSILPLQILLNRMITRINNAVEGIPTKVEQHEGFTRASLDKRTAAIAKRKLALEPWEKRFLSQEMEKEDKANGGSNPMMMAGTKPSATPPPEKSKKPKATAAPAPAEPTIAAATPLAPAFPVDDVSKFFQDLRKQLVEDERDLEADKLRFHLITSPPEMSDEKRRIEAQKKNAVTANSITQFCNVYKGVQDEWIEGETKKRLQKEQAKANANGGAAPPAASGAPNGAQIAATPSSAQAAKEVDAKAKEAIVPPPFLKLSERHLVVLRKQIDICVSLFQSALKSAADNLLD